MTDPSRIIIGDVIDGLRTLGAASVQCCVTSPPYWGLRDYGVDGQIGLEKTPDEFVAKMVDVFREVRRVLRDDGTLWLNLGDSYAKAGVSGLGLHTDTSTTGKPNPYAAVKKEIPDGLKPKDLCMIPWRVALALQADGWWLRSVICWAKKSPMPESVTDRPTSSWEPIFLLAKSERYFYDAEAVKEPASENTNPRISQAAIARISAQREAGANTSVGAGAASKCSNDGMVKTNGSFQNAVCLPVASRNQRNAWHLGPEPYAEAHFATFPTEIPRRAIKAGTSEKGCCAACGAPWSRVMERTGVLDGSARGSRFDAGKTAARTGGERTQQGERTLTVARGWEPGCECGAECVPCVVLDPFLGSGTTVAVARELGRHGVGCELNPEYAKLARERIGKAEKPATFRSDRVIDSPLFGGAS